MQEKPLDNITVIVRGAGERTTQFCLDKIEKEVNPEDIFYIQEKPFSTAVKKTFQIGLQRNRKWTLAVDADLILFENSIKAMIDNAEKYDSSLYVYQGCIVDWFALDVRQGGPHLYLTENLSDTVVFYDEMESSLRPESFFYSKMKDLGKKVIIDRKIYGLHDYYQSYQDVYRKAFFHGVKHKSWQKYIPIWMDKIKIENDYRIAIKGFEDGFVSQDQSYPSIADLHQKFQSLKNDFDLEEQKEIQSLTNIDPQLILKILNIEFYLDFSFERITGTSKNKIKRYFYRIFKNRV